MLDNRSLIGAIAIAVYLQLSRGEEKERVDQLVGKATIIHSPVVFDKAQEVIP